VTGHTAPPTPPTRFVGRRRDLEVACALLAEPGVRVVSLVGPPGVGKTRLMLEVARETASAFDGVAFASLADVRDAADVASAVVAALGLDEVGAVPPLASAAAHIGERTVLLVLDNFEHVIDAAADVAELVAQCGNLHVLTTSRRPLSIRAEHCVEVTPLPVPAHDAAADDVLRADSVELLIDRLRAVNAAPADDLSSASVLADICRALDGLPLALELVATRARSLPLTDVRDALHRRLRLLSGGDRDLPDRQRTMYDALAWSYDLLDETAAAVLRRLSVFVGGADIAAVTAVAADLELDERGLLDVLDELVSHSLLASDRHADAARFRVLEVIREFAADLVAAGGEDADARRGHAEHYLAVAEAAAPHFSRRDQLSWLDRVHRDSANFTAAARWAISHDEPDIALRLCCALRFLWYVRGPLTEGRALFEEALAMPEGPRRLRARALVEAAALARHQTDYAAGAALVQEALALADGEDDEDLRAYAQLQRGFLAHLCGDYQNAREALEASLRRRHETEDEFGAALASHHLGLVAYYGDGNLGLAWEMQCRCLALLRRIDNRRHLATVLIAMAELARARGEFDHAQELLVEGLGYVDQLRDVPLLVYGLHHAAAIAHDSGHLGRALRLIGAAEGLERASGAGPWPAVRAGTDRWLTRATGAVGASRAEIALAAGRQLAFDPALALATVAPVDVTADPLTAREREVAALVADGLTNRAIAERLVVAERTVEGHVAHVLSKLGFTSRSQIATWFTRRSLEV
jgi:predicted ATPase/DNA-binding CsgD family transcriptional regulator